MCKQNNKNFLEELKFITIENNRFDNLYILLNRFPEISEDKINIKYISKKLIEIEELLQGKEKIKIGLENILKKQLNKILEKINIGFIKLPLNNTYLPHLIIESNNLWAFDCLKNIYNDKEIFYFDEKQKTCFDYLEPNKNIDSISFKDLDTIIKYFGTKYDKILDVLRIFTKNLKSSNIQYDDEYLKYLFSSLPEQIFFSYNKNLDSIFHIISCLNLISSENKIIIEKLKELKEKNFEQFTYILNLQNSYGDTFLFKFLENEIMKFQLKF